MAETGSVEQLMQQIADEYESLSRQLKVIAKHIEQHKAGLMFDKISDLATACDVQPSAIVRFAQRFGFSGYTEMQDVFRAEYAVQANAAPNYQQRIRKLIATRDGKLHVGDMTREFIDASRAGLSEMSEDSTTRSWKRRSRCCKRP